MEAEKGGVLLELELFEERGGIGGELDGTGNAVGSELVVEAGEAQRGAGKSERAQVLGGRPGWRWPRPGSVAEA